ncbi:MAG: hypothetical protein MMC33_001789 [Icmadophila ericetorum]|nr:hypothetical protein [Icmadophila ericetorum]
MAYHNHYYPATSPYTNQYYSTSAESSPSPDDGKYDYYQPPHRTPMTPQRYPAHVRQTSYSPPRMATWNASPYTQPGFYATYDHASPTRHPSVSKATYVRRESRRYSTTGNVAPGYAYETLRRPSMRSQKRPIIIDDVFDADDSPRYVYVEPKTSAHQRRAKADPEFFTSQVPVYEQVDSHSVKPRKRSASHPIKSQSTKPAPSTKTQQEATEEDRTRHKIPAGYSMKNWDPTERPIKLVGSVFDANSLGKWIYDWTVYQYKAGTPISEVAGELWLLLIRLAAKTKRAEAALPRIKSRSKSQLIQDFIDSGERLWHRLKKLLKACEEYMYESATRDKVTGSMHMGKDSGCQFVEAMFGRHRELEKTEALMQQLRTWSMRFDANAEDILAKKR